MLDAKGMPKLQKSIHTAAIHTAYFRQSRPIFNFSGIGTRFPVALCGQFS